MTSDPAVLAALIAVRIVLLDDGPPRLMLMICAADGACTGNVSLPVAGKPAAYRIPCAISKLVPSPVMPSTRIGRIFTLQFTPVGPVPSFPAAPMIPAVHSP